jgi:3-deoxy-manno-octulosonate cytidylyltransferase (CMP-KDO synthetase)
MTKSVRMGWNTAVYFPVDDMAAPQTLIIIPARMASTRLPGKPLADIHGQAMIVHVWRRAQETGLGRVVVAAAESEIAAAVQAAGGEAVLTDPAHPSGSDRVHEAVQKLDPARQFDRILNVQGDLPTVEPGIVKRLWDLLDDPTVSLSTLVTKILREDERSNPNVVKAVVAWKAGGEGDALYFTRATAPHGPGDHWHHIGLYGWRRSALERFVKLPPSPLELREKLEQLRALEVGMRVAVAAVETVPLGVDTPEDLERARDLLKP